MIGTALSSPVHAAAPDGQLVQFNDNGIWCWFEDNRAIIDVNTNQLLISTIASGDGAGGAARDSHNEVVSYSLTNNTVTAPATLIDYKAVLGIIADDHNTPALNIRSDGRYVATYTAHQNDNVIRTRVSTNPGDATSWGPEQTLSVASNRGTTYSNVYTLSSTGLTYDFFRGHNYDPHVLVSSNDGTTYTYAGHLLMDPGNSAGQRPYVRYASNGVDKVFFLTTTGHPNEGSTSIYAGYMDAQQRVHSLDGTDLGPLGTYNGVATSVAACTPVMMYNTGVNGTARTHMWSTDIELDSSGKPYFGFTSRVNSSTADHRFYYSRWNGSALVTNEVARAGGFLYTGQSDYTGLMALSPSDPNTLYISTKIDPRDSTGATATNKYEIYRGYTTDSGATWQWVPITVGSTDDNIRPVAPTWDSTHTSLLWMKGTYTNYQHADMALVGKFYTGNNGQWTNTAGGTWTTAGNWNEGRTADGMSFLADFASLDITGTQTVSLAGGTRKLGFLTFGDTNTATSGSWTLGNGTLNLDGGVISPIVNVKNGSATISAVLAGTQGVMKAGVGTLTVSGTNTYTGDTVVSAGTLVATGGSAVPNGSVVNVAGGATFTVVASETIGGLAGAGNVNVTGTPTLTVGGNNVSASFGGVVGGATKLAKTGTGRQTLTGANTYTGTTAVNGGTLALGAGGSLAGTAVTVSGGTLQSTDNNTIGTAGSPTVTLAANAGNLSLVSGGNNTLTINSATAAATVLTLAGGNVLSFDSNAVGGDGIVLGAGLKALASGANTINLNLIARPTATQTLTLINAPGGLTGGNTFALGTITGASTFGVTFALQATATQLQLVETTGVAPTVAYFVGNRGTAWSANNGTLGNFSTNAAGTTAVTVLPDATTDVHLYAANATLASVAASTIDSPFAIKTLTIDGGSAPVGIGATGTGSLTIKPVTSTTGLTVNSGSVRSASPRRSFSARPRPGRTVPPTP
ncbi:MAG: BNR-4 repeat-containing protein [Tepidisphaeraceae bacterium]